MTDQPTITVSEGGLELPVEDVLTGRGALFGKSGSGKSNSVGVIAEELLEQGFPLVIIDADGEHYALKEEYELLHVGASRDDAEAIITPENAPALADLVLEEDVAAILDVSEFPTDETKAVVRAFIERLFRKAKAALKPFPVFVEEAQELVPQTNHPDETAKALIRVAKRGRKRGLGITVISQRPANVNKDAVTQHDWSVWHKLSYPTDTRIVKDVIDATYAEAVQDLGAGEAIVKADFLDAVRTVQFTRKQTFDAGATPGLDDWTRPELKSVSPAVIDRLEDVTDQQEAEQSELDRLEAELEDAHERRRELEAEIQRLREERPPGDADPEEIERLQADLDRVAAERDELSERVDELESALERERDQRTEIEADLAAAEDARDTLDQVRDDLRVALADAGVEIDADTVSGDDDRVEALESQVDRLEAENERLREQDGDATVVSIPTAYEEFYEHETVENAIEAAIDAAEAGEKAIWGTVLTIAEQGGPTTYQMIQDYLGYSSHSQVSKAVTELENREVVTTASENPKRIDFNFDGMAEIERKHKLREDMEERIEQRVS